MRYYSDGHALLEVLAEDFHRNYGLGGTFLREVAVRDCRTGDARLVHGCSLAALTPVQP